MKDTKGMIASPAMYFRTVQNLVESKELDLKEKLIALYNWKSTCELQKASTAEGMGGERTSPIADILRAIREIEELSRNQ